jgi:hypothetical protein
VNKKDRAIIGFIAGTIVTAALNKAIDEEADTLGVPHVVAGLIAAAIANSL